MEPVAQTLKKYAIHGLLASIIWSLATSGPSILGVDLAQAQTPIEAEWSDEFSFNPGCNGVIRAAVVDSAGIVYVGGQFTACGAIAATNVARYDPTNGSWSALGGGISGAYYGQGIFALEIYQGNLVAGGYFALEEASYLAQWDGNSWEEVAGGVSGRVLALQADGPELYVGGAFSEAGGIDTPYAARLLDGQWFPLTSASSSYSLSGPVVDITTVEEQLYFAAEFSIEGELRRDFLAHWDGTNWQPLGNGVNEQVLSITGHAGQLVAAGAFTSAGTASTRGVAIWNGVIWNSLPCGTPSSTTGPRDLLSVNDELFIGVRILSGFAPEASLYRWRNGQCELVKGFYAQDRLANIHALASTGETLYLFGILDPSNMLTFDGSAIDVPSQGDGKGLYGQPSGSTLAIEEGLDGMYFAGSFTNAGRLSASNVAKWTGSDWARLETATGEGVNSTILSLEMFQGSLYLGGFFTAAGGASANGIARWDGLKFHSLETLPEEIWGITAMEAFEGQLLVAPSYLDPPANDRSSLLRWDGSTWGQFSDFWDGASRGRINDILAVGNSLYVTGHFDAVMNIPAHNIAVYQDSRWQALGEGLQAGDEFGASGLALHHTEGVLYVGGRFDQAGLNTTHNFAAWDGDIWLPEVEGTSFASSSSISAITSDRNCIYVGGTFRQLSDLAIDNLGCLLRNHTWAPVLNGVDGSIRVLFPTEIDSLWVGGDFKNVPPYAAHNIAFLDGPELIFRSDFD